ncbi:MAG TPA: hypothetical protein VF574_06740 [Allosphingosinicella sp.]|jgi:hypothetical protein
MLIALLLAAAQPAQVSPQDKALEASRTFRAYREWRICLDGRLGRPPRLRPSPAALEAALSACRSQEEALGAAAAGEWGPAAGPVMFQAFSRDVRAEYAAAAPVP